MKRLSKTSIDSTSRPLPSTIRDGRVKQIEVDRFDRTRTLTRCKERQQ
ncbi:MAG: hypothetical protein J7641_13365 [Cyanobacteria bacterium SID2]|nr:hypothetical protein [Cyanobacteria bacterium SID2]MBP0006621.1 hypothetical protein [Cyanobacteria bacterium SBC]